MACASGAQSPPQSEQGMADIADPLSAASSARISLHSPMHSLQMYTVGPAMSFATSI